MISKRSASWHISVFFLSILLTPHHLSASSFLEQSERLQLIYAHLLDYRPNGPPAFETNISWQLGADFLIIPYVDTKLGSQKMAMEASPVVLRPRFRYYSHSGLFLGAAWIPPVQMPDYTSNVRSAEVGYSPLHTLRWKASIRSFVSAGEVVGPIVNQQADDFFSLDRAGVDINIGYLYGNFYPYAGAGSGSVDTKLRIEAEASKFYVRHHHYAYHHLGVAYRYQESLLFNFEQSWTETFVRHLTLSMNYLFQ